MDGIYFMFPALLAIFLSFLFVRAAAIALMLTGMDRRRAVFQALSAFTGTGFTTREAERVINHPTRRRIVSWLMVLGNAGIIAVIITATSSIVTSKGYLLPVDIFILVLGTIIIYKLAPYTRFVRRWERYIEKKLVKSAAFEEEAVEDLLHTYRWIRSRSRNHKRRLFLDRNIDLSM
jgi:ABC-type multidrug transport system fused ATPase/permease subunit